MDCWLSQMRDDQRQPLTAPRRANPAGKLAVGEEAPPYVRDKNLF
jgi:hypothetical protein